MKELVRVLHVLGGLDAGGAENFVMNLYKSVDRKKVQFDFIKHVANHGIFEEEIIQMGGKIYQCPQFTGNNYFAYYSWWKDFFKHHSEYHIVHGHVRSTAAIYLKVANNYGLITIAHSHSTSNGKSFSSIVKDIMQLPIRHTADYLFACSDKAGVWLYGKKAIINSNYRVIPNGINLNRFSFNKERRKIVRHQLGIAEDTIVLGHIGRFSQAKNHRFLVNLFYEYYRKNSNSKLLLVGDGELFENVKQQVIKLGINNAVIMAGTRADTEDYYQAMDIFIFPSLWEGLGIVVIEAQANGLPCVVSDNVPKEALVAKNIEVLNLEKMEKWLSVLMKYNIDARIPVDKILLEYDISTIANQMQKFYLEQNKRDK